MENPPDKIVIKTATNRRLAKKRVQWLNEHSASYQILCWIDSLVLRNPLLRQAPKRYRSCIRTVNTSTLLLDFLTADLKLLRVNYWQDCSM